MLNIDWSTLNMTCDECLVKPMCQLQTCSLLEKANRDHQLLNSIENGARRLCPSLFEEDYIRSISIL